MSINNIEQGILHHKNDSFHFTKVGTGKKVAIFFHGMGKSPEDYWILQEPLSHQYTFINFYLPFHGPQLLQEKSLKPEVLMALIQGIKNTFNSNKISLWGHSIGARICLKVVELQANWIEELILFSPDGIAKNFWYNLATTNRVGRFLFKTFTKNPEKFVNIIGNLRLSSKIKINLARQFIQDKNRLMQVYHTWTSLHYMAPFIPVVKANIKKHKINTKIFMGSKDPLIPLNPILSFGKKSKNIQIFELQDGHHLITRKHVAYFLEHLNN